MLMRDQHLYKSLAKEAYGHCRLRLGALLIFNDPGLQKFLAWPGIKPTTLAPSHVPLIYQPQRTLWLRQYHEIQMGNENVRKYLYL